MLDLGLGSLQALPFEDLVYRLLMMTACVAVVTFVGFDTIIVAIMVTYAVPIAVELVRRAWFAIRSRLRGPQA